MDQNDYEIAFANALKGLDALKTMADERERMVLEAVLDWLSDDDENNESNPKKDVQ